MVICSLQVFQSSFELKPIGRENKNTVKGTNTGNRKMQTREINDVYSI